MFLKIPINSTIRTNFFFIFHTNKLQIPFFMIFTKPIIQNTTSLTTLNTISISIISITIIIRIYLLIIKLKL